MPLRLFVFGKLLRVGGRVARVNFHLAHGGARLGDFNERGLLEVGRALDRLHQVRNLVRATLVIILHLRPLLIHVL